MLICEDVLRRMGGSEEGGFGAAIRKNLGRKHICEKRRKNTTHIIHNGTDHIDQDLEDFAIVFRLCSFFRRTDNALAYSLEVRYCKCKPALFRRVASCTFCMIRGRR
jgi:hypothetical protein